MRNAAPNAELRLGPGLPESKSTLPTAPRNPICAVIASKTANLGTTRRTSGPTTTNERHRGHARGGYKEDNYAGNGRFTQCREKGKGKASIA
ncbi:hypothetical protein SBOR_4505 [Sclerotinia borealis F-4128]|uniref:Uncharacterized protein n=1 Tax=Sclerotinia borealis (strain F-4128) TaxID=1432307 RepID=W9CGM6_SCLBF|nr:hypothetical protein SBOR_4505 [Sclerotinia borealis F-4128]